MIKCKDCGKIEPKSRWNEHFGKHELCEKCLREHEHFKCEYISRVFKQAGIKNSYGYLTIKALPRDSKEVITIIKERLIDRMDLGILIYELEDALKDDIFPDNPFCSQVVIFTLLKSRYNGKNILLRNSEINNMIETFYNTGSVVCIEYSDYSEEMRTKESEFFKALEQKEAVKNLKV